MTTARKGFSCFWVELAAAGFFESFTRDKEHFYGYAPNGKRKKYYGEKKNLHFNYLF